jgi:hypothetical protein
MKLQPDFPAILFRRLSRNQDKGEEQKQLSKEFVNRWLIQNGFQVEGNKPDMRMNILKPFR